MSKKRSFFWRILKHIPEPVKRQFRRYRLLFQRKNELLIALPCFLSFTTQANVIWIYSFSGNSWQKYQIQGPWFDSRFIYPGAIIKNKIYSYSTPNEIVMFELLHGREQCKYNIINTNWIHKLHTNGASVMIGDEFHYIANKHIKYNINTQIYEFVPSAPVLKIINEKSLMRIKDKLVLFGASMHYRNIFEYNIKENCWRCLPVTLPSGAWVVSCTPILNGQMILIATDDSSIYIYEVNKQILKKSNVKLPTKNGVRVDNEIFAINNQRKDILVTWGWIRIEHEHSKLVPKCLIALIKAYYLNEFLHTINSFGEHYRINVFQILNCC